MPKCKLFLVSVLVSLIAPAVSFSAGWELVGRFQYTNQSSSINETINWDGEKDRLILIVAKIRYISGSGAATIGLRFNNDSGTNYHRSYIQQSGTTASGTNIGDISYVHIGFVNSTYVEDFSEHTGVLNNIGSPRIVISKRAFYRSSGNTLEQHLQQSVWKNTSSNITSLTLFSVEANATFSGFIEFYRWRY